MEKLVNNSQTTLQIAMNALVLTIRPVSGGTWPISGQFRVHADSELMLVSGGIGPVYTILTRGVENTTAASHLVGVTLTIVLTAVAMEVWLAENALTDPVAAHLAYIGPSSGANAPPTFRPLVASDIPSLSNGIPPVKTADYTVAAGDYLVRVDTSGGNVIITLPQASTVIGKIVNVKHVVAGNIMTIQRTNADTIDGAATVLSNAARTNIALQAAAAGIWVIE